MHRKTIALLIVIIFVLIWHADYERYKMMSGMWVIDPDFAQEAGLTDGYIYIDKNEGSSFSAFLHMRTGDGVIINRVVCMTMQNWVPSYMRSLTELRMHINIEGDLPFANDVYLEMNPRLPSITLTDSVSSDVVGFFLKNAVAG